MLQPYPLAIGEKLDFQFNAGELTVDGDTISEYSLTSSTSLTVTDDTEASEVITFFAFWGSGVEVGTPGWVEATITSTSGRILVKRMTFFAAEPTT